MQDLITRALRNNHDLRLAALNIEQARAQAAARDADFWPTLSLGASGVRQSSASGKVVSSYSVGLQTSGFEVDVFGRLKGLSESAAAQLLAISENRRAIQLSLVAAVASAYVTLRMDDEGLQLAQDVATSREATQRLTRLRFEHGASSVLDLRAADAALEAARGALAQAQRQRSVDLHALGLLVASTEGAWSSTPLPPSKGMGQVGAIDLQPGLPSEVLARRPDVRQAEEVLRAARANVDAARAAMFPRMTLTGASGTASADLANLFKSGFWAWSLAPQLVQTVFDAGRNEAAVSSARTGRDLALTQYEKAIQVAFREANDALVSHATWKEQLQALQLQDRAEQDRLRLIQLKFQQGVASELDLLEAQRAAWSVHGARIQAEAQTAQARIALYKALGGGWTSTSQP